MPTVAQTVKPSLVNRRRGFLANYQMLLGHRATVDRELKAHKQSIEDLFQAADASAELNDGYELEGFKLKRVSGDYMDPQAFDRYLMTEFGVTAAMLEEARKASTRAKKPYLNIIVPKDEKE